MTNTMARLPIRMTTLLSVVALFSAFPFSQVSADSNQRAAETITVPVATFVPAQLINAANYQMQPDASIFRGYATFTLKTDFGETDVEGAVNLLERITELQAIDTLKAMKKSDVYKDAVKKSAGGPVNTVKGLANEPVDTVSNAAKGLGGFLADVGYSIVSDDPNEDNAAKTLVGFAAAKRQLAYKLGVSPYSAFQPLQDELSEVSWTAVGGSMTITAAFSVLKNTPGQVIRITSTADKGQKMVRDNSPRQLANLNQEALVAMGVSEALAETFLDNHNYTPATATRVVTALDSMQGIGGRGDLIARAATAGTPQEASQMRDWVELLAAFHTKIAAVKKIVIVATVPMLVGTNNTVIGIFPTDYIVKTPGISGRISALSASVEALGYPSRSLYATGKIDPTMAEFLRAQGWSGVHDNLEKTLRTE